MPSLAAVPYGVRETWKSVAIAGTDLTASTALTLGTFAPGYVGSFEGFGFEIDTLLTSGGALALLWQVQDQSSNVIAQLTLTEAAIITAALARGQGVSTTVLATSNDGIRPAFANFTEATVLTLKRISGTAATAGAGRFWLRVSQRIAQG